MERVWHRTCPIGTNLAARDAEDVRYEELRIDLRRVDPCLRQLLLGEAQRFIGGHSPSARRRSSAVSASVNSSSSPWSARSSWWVVSLMRWSVMRFSGKLYVRIFSA